MARFAISFLVFAVFTTFSVWVIATEGWGGLLAVHAVNAWGPQVLIDLVIACTFAMSWLVPDAKKHGIAAWPFVVAVVVLGSISTLAYLCIREWKRMRDPSLSQT